jgi:hypothetical protein
MPDWSVMKVAVGCRVHFDDEGRKEHMETQAVHSNEATSVLALMGTEAVQGISKVGNMETISDQNRFPFKEMMAVPYPWIGANELLPMRTHQPKTG